MLVPTKSVDTPTQRAMKRLEVDQALYSAASTLLERNWEYDEAHFIAFAPVSHVLDFVNDLKEGKPSGFGE